MKENDRRRDIYIAIRVTRESERKREILSY